MKTGPLFVVIIVMFCLSQGTARTQTNKSVSEGGGPSNNQGLYDQWIKHGQLSVDDNACNGIHSYSYFYKSPSGQWIILQNNIEGINELFTNELTSKEAIAEFMHEKIADFLFSTMGLYDWNIIDKSLAQRWGVKNDKDRLKLESYASNNLPVVIGNKWALKLNVITNRGGVERWLITGSVNPFQISSFKREAAEANWTFAGIATSS